MINKVFLEQLKKYNPENILEIKNAMKEVLQNIILCGLSKSDFFKYAVFYGGTSLRIFRNLPRFSEDLDFTLLNPIDDFNFDSYLKYSKRELSSIMIDCEIYSKEKNTTTSVVSRYFKFNMKNLFSMSYVEYENKIINNEILTIKVEVEKECFSGGNTEIKILTYPSFGQIRTFDISSLFSSKLIAILNRKWKSRIKGRDFYDYLFYVSNDIKVNLVFLENGLKKFGYLDLDEELTIERLREELKQRFESVDFDEAKKDVQAFINKNDRFIESFNKDIFIGTIDLIK